uniref:Death domain-containing protein n=1 Tax=Amphimedon queenslandica TaxID=400682 RepID=A0A1X7U0P6_AMPQE
KKDFYGVYDIIKPLSAGWKQIAISWHLEIDTINRIEADCRGDTIACLQKVVEYWLKKDYDYERYGIPCWRRVCVAVKEGGGDPALADEIAREHPLPATTGGATPHPLPATTSPTDVVHNDEIPPLGGGNSNHNETLHFAKRGVPPTDVRIMSPGSEKSNNSRG